MDRLEMSNIVRILICCGLLLTLWSRFGKGVNVVEPGHARKLQLFNCNHDSEALPATAYNICTKAEGGNWYRARWAQPHARALD